MEHPEPIARLIDELRKLPGLGPKSAQRVAFHLLKTPHEDAARLADAIRDLGARIRLCERCNSFTDEAVCRYCSDRSRTDSLVCVVEEPANIASVERTGGFRGRYHVLHGALSPIHGVGPDELKVQGLLDRVRDGSAQEVILATSPTVEGEATAIYLARLLRALGVRVTRIATGLPAGSDLDWADEVTMSRALDGRRDF